MLETIPLELIPPTHTVHAALYRDVKNAAHLHSQLLARNPEFEYAFVDASVVTSRVHVLSAAFRALTAQIAGTLKTPNVHSELVTSLSPSQNVCTISTFSHLHSPGKNKSQSQLPVHRGEFMDRLLEERVYNQPANKAQIADAYRRFGISPATKDLVVVKMTFPTDAAPTPATREEIQKHLDANVEGTPVPLTDEEIGAATDWAKVRKYYKLNGLAWLDAIKDDKEKRRQLDGLVLGAMALRGV